MDQHQERWMAQLCEQWISLRHMKKQEKDIWNSLHYHFDDPDIRDVHIGQFPLISEHLGSFPWTAPKFSLVPWLPSVPITCSFGEMVLGKRARRLEITIVIISNIEGKVELDCYRKHSRGLSLLFRHHWGHLEWRAKQLKWPLAHFLHFVLTRLLHFLFGHNSRHNSQIFGYWQYFRKLL